VIIPFSTDAPIYHRPWATLGVILANVAAHVAWSYAGPEAAEPYTLILSSGLHPLQWLAGVAAQITCFTPRVYDNPNSRLPDRSAYRIPQNLF